MMNQIEKRNSRERLMERFPCDEPGLGQEIREHWLSILTGEYDASEKVHAHRQHCIPCAHFLAQKYDSMKNKLKLTVPLKTTIEGSSGLIHQEDLGYAAGAIGVLRTFTEQSLRDAGFGSGFFIEVSEEKAGEYAIKVVSETPKRFLLSFLDQEDVVMLECEISNFPVYISADQIKSHCKYGLVELS